MISNSRNAGLRKISVLNILFCVTITSCTTLSTVKDGKPVRLSRGEFAEYAEATFRHHNLIVNEIITTFSLGDDDARASEELTRAEEKMSAVCQPLNEMVNATVERRKISLWAKLRLPDQVPQCADATRSVERILSVMQ